MKKTTHLSFILITLLFLIEKNVLSVNINRNYNNIGNDSGSLSVMPLSSTTTTTTTTNSSDPFLNPLSLSCVEPLVPGFKDSNATICHDGCCLPCPFEDNFYQKDLTENTYKTFAILGVLSFFLMILLSILFIFLPSQRQNPTVKQILLPLSLSVAYYQMTEFFTISRQNTLCINEIEPANIYNNSSCRAQAVFALGGSYAIALWSAILIMHLHLLSVWRSEFITRNIYYLHSITWTVSILATIIPIITGKVEANQLCFISKDANIYYFSPLGFTCFIFIAHAFTFVYIAKINLRANWRVSIQSGGTPLRNSISEAQRTIYHVKSILQVQWRALLGALLMLIIYLINLTYYIMFDRRSPLTTENGGKLVVEQWVECLNRGIEVDTTSTTISSIEDCSSIIEPYVLPYPLILTLSLFNRSMGILIFIIFAAKKSIILEVWGILQGSRSSFNKHPPPKKSSVSGDRLNARLNARARSMSTSDERRSFFSSWYEKFSKIDFLFYEEESDQKTQTQSQSQLQQQPQPQTDKNLELGFRNDKHNF